MHMWVRKLNFAVNPISGSPEDLELKDLFHVLVSREPASSFLWLSDPGFAMPSWATQCRVFHYWVPTAAPIGYCCAVKLLQLERSLMRLVE